MDGLVFGLSMHCKFHQMTGESRIGFRQEPCASSELYRARGAEPVLCDADSLRQDGYEVTQAPLQGARPTATLRHDPRSLSLAVMRFYRRHRKDSPQRRGESPAVS